MCYRSWPPNIGGILIKILESRAPSDANYEISRDPLDSRSRMRGLETPLVSLLRFQYWNSFAEKVSGEIEGFPPRGPIHSKS